MSDLSKMVTFLKMVITGVKNWSPDMIVTPFDGKFDEKKDEIPPRVCRPLKKLKNNNVEKVDPTKVETKQCRTSGPPKSFKKQCRKSAFMYPYIPSYTSIYLHIPPYTSIYFQIALYTFIYPSYTFIYPILKH